MIKRFIDGTEAAVGVIDNADGPRALPVVETVPEGDLYDYHARYTAGTTEFFCPASFDDDTTAAGRSSGEFIGALTPPIQPYSQGGCAEIRDRSRAHSNASRPSRYADKSGDGHVDDGER